MRRVFWDLESRHSLADLGLADTAAGWEEYRSKCGVSWAVVFEEETGLTHHFSCLNPTSGELSPEDVEGLVGLIEGSEERWASTRRGSM